MTGTSSDPGVIPRLVDDLFAQAAAVEETGVTSVRIACSLLEIYNEALVDLLAPGASTKLEVREDASLGSLQYDVPISHLPPEQCAAELNSVECYPNPRHWIPTDRSRGPSKSTSITDCHWPSTSAPSTTGIDSDEPSSMLPK